MITGPLRGGIQCLPLWPPVSLQEHLSTSSSKPLASEEPNLHPAGSSSPGRKTGDPIFSLPV